MLGEMFYAYSSCRYWRGLSFRLFSTLDLGKTTVHSGFLCLDCSCGSRDYGGSHKGSSAAVLWTGCLVCLDEGVGFLSVSAGIADRSILAGLYSVHAGNAAAIVDFMLGGVDAGSLALLSAESAVTAFFGIDHRSKDAET